MNSITSEQAGEIAKLNGLFASAAKDVGDISTDLFCKKPDIYTLVRTRYLAHCLKHGTPEVIAKILGPLFFYSGERGSWILPVDAEKEFLGAVSETLNNMSEFKASEGVSLDIAFTGFCNYLHTRTPDWVEANIHYTPQIPNIEAKGVFDRLLDMSIRRCTTSEGDLDISKAFKAIESWDQIFCRSIGDYNFGVRSSLVLNLFESRANEMNEIVRRANEYFQEYYRKKIEETDDANKKAEYRERIDNLGCPKYDFVTLSSKKSASQPLIAAEGFRLQ